MPFTSPIPSETPIVDQARNKDTGKLSFTGFMSAAFVDWFLELVGRVNNSPEQYPTVTLTAQQAAIATTPIPMPSVGAGLYRVSVYGKVTQAATVSSSLAATIGWTDGGNSCTAPIAAVTGNSLTTVLLGSAYVRSDRATALTYATGYASVGATPMQYSLDVQVEGL